MAEEQQEPFPVGATPTVEQFPELAKCPPPIEWVSLKYQGGGCHRKNAEWYSYISHVGKVFTYSKYGSKEAAEAAGEAYRRAECVRLGKYRNVVGFFTTTDGERRGICTLTRGKIHLFEPSLLPFVEEHTWSGAESIKPVVREGQAETIWYPRTMIKGKGVYFHQLAFPDVEIVDHVDHKGTHNFDSNLRFTTQSGNLHNMSIGSRNKTGILGVPHYEHKGEMCWFAQWQDDEGVPRLKKYRPSQFGEDGAFYRAVAMRRRGEIINDYLTNSMTTLTPEQRVHVEKLLYEVPPELIYVAAKKRTKRKREDTELADDDEGDAKTPRVEEVVA